ncbi:DNA repair protein RecO [Candidatus Falkowbacteria bacterium]|nr:MAG: DNA repair protein RecO [Candidatus Falkowbacteria bacterium]
MEETFLIKGIILDREPFRECDSRVCVYSLENGRQDLIARGTKKIISKLSGHIEPFSCVNIMGIRGKRLNYLGSALEEDSYKQIKKNLDKIYYAGTGLRIFKDLIKEGVAEKEIFYLLKNYLNILNKEELGKTQLELFLHFFILKLLCLLGYRPELFYCVKCKKKALPGGNYFSFSGGGLVCNTCQKNKNSLTLSDNSVKLLRLVLKEDLKKLCNLKIDDKLAKEIIKTISSFLQYYKS